MLAEVAAIATIAGAALLFEQASKDVDDSRIGDLASLIFFECSVKTTIEEEKAGFCWVMLNRFRSNGSDWDKALASINLSRGFLNSIKSRTVRGANVLQSPEWGPACATAHRAFIRHNLWVSSSGRLSASPVGSRHNYLHIRTQLALGRKVPTWATNQVQVGSATFCNLKPVAGVPFDGQT